MTAHLGMAQGFWHAAQRSRVRHGVPASARRLLGRAGWLCVVLVVGVGGGCSERRDYFDRKPTIKVTGIVLSKGRPAAGALVTFMRAAGADSEYPGAQGLVGDDGTYELTTYSTRDGAIVGEYIVAVVWPTRPDWWNAEEEMAALDRLKGKYAPGRSDIRRAIREDTQQVETIELN